MKQEREQILDSFIQCLRRERKKEIKESSEKSYRKWARRFYPFDELTKEKINQRLAGKSPYTHNLYLLILTKLAQFGFIEKDLLEDFQRKNEEPKYTSKKQLITRDELKQFIDVAEEIEMKAFYSLLYESGARIGEMLNIKRSDIYTIKKKDDSIEWNVFLYGKTGAREIPIIECLSYLLPYLNHRGPFEGQLWQTSKANEVLVYSTARDRLEADRIKIAMTKKITLHTFRHSRATELAAKLTIAVLMDYFGWSDVNTAKRYVHLAGADLRNAMNSYYGLSSNEERIQIINCPVCNIPICDEMDSCPQCNHSFIRNFSKTEKESDRAKIIRMLNDPDIASRLIDLFEYGLAKEGEG